METDYKNEGQRKTAEKIIGIEKEALDKFMKGDTSMYRKIWSKDNLSYYDIATRVRTDSYGDMMKFMDRVEKILKTNSYEVKNERVQFSNDGTVAILTYQLFADCNTNDMRYNVVEVYDHQDDDSWKVIHCTYSTICPYELKFTKIRNLLGIKDEDLKD